MPAHELDFWTYESSGDGDAYYLSSSQKIAIIYDAYEGAWLWRVYDGGMPEMSVYDVLSDQRYDHELAYFENPHEAYRDVIQKGYERTVAGF